MVRYFKHREKDVICELIGSVVRFNKWKWNGNTCEESYTFKSVSREFHKSFKEIDTKEYHNIYGIKLESIKK